MLTVKDLSFAYGPEPVFEEVSFSVSGHQKVGLMGPNGAGKSTLLSLISKERSPDEGEVIVTGNHGLVPQEVKRDEALEHADSIRNYLDPEHSKQDFELERILTGLELEELKLDRPPQQLSGGQKTKLALGRALLAEPDLLLLDEPTNFLDVAGKRWVMNFLSHYPHSFILISHDIELIDKQIDKVIAIDPRSRRIEEYRGNYSHYLAEKDLREEQIRREIINQRKKIKRMEEGYTRLKRNKSASGVKKRVQQRERIAELKHNLPQLPPAVRRIKVNLPEPAHIGSIPLEVKEISKSFGENEVLRDINFTIMRGERLALIGPNGSGKSTLIKVIMGLLEAGAGEIKRNPNLNIGYYSQEFESFDMSQTLMELSRSRSQLTEQQIRPILGRFLFPGEKIYQQIGTLSGGEKTRLAIALIVMQDHNLLILDEPTTYLDPLSQRIILEALKDYKGSMIVVSHTSQFITELEPTRGLLLPSGLFDFWSPKFSAHIEEV